MSIEELSKTGAVDQFRANAQPLDSTAIKPARLGLWISSAWLQTAGLVSLTVVSSVLLSVSLPPYDFGGLAWFALAPLFFALRRASAPAALGLSALFGALFGMQAFSWLKTLPGVSLPSYLFMVFAFNLYFLVFGFLYRRFRLHHGWWLLLTAPALWVSLEFIRSNLGFLSLPWNLVGHSQYRYVSILQMVAFTGVSGLSFLIIMMNQALSEFPGWLIERNRHSVSHRGRSDCRLIQFSIAVILLLAALGYGRYCLMNQEATGTLRVALVQANVLAREGMSDLEQVAHLRAYQQLNEQAATFAPDLIVWPSTSLPSGMSSSRLVNLMVRRMASASGAYVLVGGAGGEKFQPKRDGYLNYSNSEFLVSPGGELKGQYNKMLLLPFNEYLPLRGYVSWPSWITTLRNSFEPGIDYRLFEVSGARFGAPICWENLFADHFRQFVKTGAHFMVSATNEGFFGHSTGPFQTLAMNVFRAAENRVTVVRASTTGISAFISSSGEILDHVSDMQGNVLFVSGFLIRDIPLATTRTFYTLYGDIFAYLFMAIAIGGAILTMRRQ